MDPQHPQRFPRVVRGHRQRDMSEKALGAPADDTQADAVSEKPKRTGVMQDPNDRVTTHPVMGLVERAH